MEQPGALQMEDTVVPTLRVWVQVQAQDPSPTTPSPTKSSGRAEDARRRRRRHKSQSANDAKEQWAPALLCATATDLVIRFLEPAEGASDAQQALASEGGTSKSLPLAALTELLDSEAVASYLSWDWPHDRPKWPQALSESVAESESGSQQAGRNSSRSFRAALIFRSETVFFTTAPLVIRDGQLKVSHAQSQHHQPEDAHQWLAELSAAKSRAQAIEKARLRSPLESTSDEDGLLGVTAEFLLDVAARVKQSHPQDYEQLSSRDVCSQFVARRTEGVGLSFVDMVALGFSENYEPGAWTGRPTVYVVHSLDAPFSALVASLLKYATEWSVHEENPTGSFPIFWLDVFCANQHAPTRHLSSDWLTNVLPRHLCDIGSVVVSIPSWRDAAPLHTPRTLWEIDSCLRAIPLEGVGDREGAQKEGACPNDSSAKKVDGDDGSAVSTTGQRTTTTSCGMVVLSPPTVKFAIGNHPLHLQEEGRQTSNHPEKLAADAGFDDILASNAAVVAETLLSGVYLPRGEAETVPMSADRVNVAGDETANVDGAVALAMERQEVGGVAHVLSRVHTCLKEWLVRHLRLDLMKKGIVSDEREADARTNALYAAALARLLLGPPASTHSDWGSIDESSLTRGGPVHLPTVQSLEEFGNEKREEVMQEALPLLQTVISTFKRFSPATKAEEDVFFQCCEASGDIYSARTNTSFATQHYIEALELCKGTDARGKIRAARVQLKLGLAHASNHNFDEAEAAYSTCLGTRIRLFGLDNAAVAQVQKALGDLECTKDNYDDAIKHYDEALATVKQCTNNEHAPVLRAILRASLGSANAKIGCHEEAEQHFNAAISTIELARGHLNETTAQIRVDHAMALSRNSETIASAQDEMREAVSIYKHVLGSLHPTTKATAQLLRYIH